ncbi:MAG: hypothetical protein J5501_06785 [Ruminococcus sp.]|nr:hypothetical protein [Ruminococcus sp.]
MHRIFTGLAAVAAVLAAASFAVLYKHLIEIPEKYTTAAIFSMSGFALLGVIFFYIGSAIQQRGRFRNTDNTATGPIPAAEGNENYNTFRNDKYTINQINIYRGKVIGIFGRAVVAAGISWFLGLRENPLVFLPMYILVSYCWVFIKATRNYIIGILAFVVLFFAVDAFADKLQGNIKTLVLAAFLFGIIIIDIISISRYIMLKLRINL